MNNKIKAVTIGDISGIGIKLLINLWKFKKNKIGKFILISNYNLFNEYINKNNINLSYLKINDLKNIKKIFNKFLPIYDIKADNNIFLDYFLRCLKIKCISTWLNILFIIDEIRKVAMLGFCY